MMGDVLEKRNLPWQEVGEVVFETGRDRMRSREDERECKRCDDTAISSGKDVDGDRRFGEKTSLG